MRSRLLLPTALAAVGLLAACSGTPAATSAPTTPAEPTTAATTAAAAYPVTVDNCGTEVSVTKAPERIVTIKSSATELVLALGLGHKLVGTAFSDGPLPADLEAAGAAAPVLAEKAPSQEAVLAVEPDFVFGGWESNFAADTAGERPALAQLGVTTYVSPAACQEPQYRPDPLTFDGVFADIAQAGALLGAPQAAADLIEREKTALATVPKSTSGLTALWYSSGSDTPFVGGGIGAPQLIMDTVGLTNIEAGVQDSWASVSWEAIAAANPDVIVLVDSAWGSAEKKKGVLAANPVTAALPAVQHGRYLVVPFPASEAGVRTVSAAADLAAQLAALGPIEK